MKDTQEIIDELYESRKRVLGGIDNVTEEDFFTKPDETSWSVGEVMEHLIILESYINKVFIGTVEATQRRPDEKIPAIREMMSSDSKLFAPEPISPKSSLKSKSESIQKFSFGRDQLSRFSMNYDLSETCLDFKHAVFGYMSRIEWIYFAILHADRHLKQIERVKDSLGKGQLPA